jgi:diguanylate cyclase (GGDEF)-like protein
MKHMPGTTAVTLTRLLALARDLLQAPDPHSVLELTGPVIQELLLADGALLLLILGEQDYAAEYDRNGLMKTARDSTALYRHARQAIDNQTPILLPNVVAEPKISDARLCAGETISLIAFPFPPIKPVGVLAVFWNCDGHPHQPAEPIPILRHIGELTAAALGNVAYRQMIEDRITARTEEITASTLKHAKELHRRDHVEEELHRISVTDVMTGMLNRRGFFLNAERSFKVAQRQEVPSTIVYADLDDLKNVNDALGHETGDRLIQDAGRILQASFRDSDVVARLGGDEFAVYTLDAEQPEVLLDRIRLNIESFRHSEARPYEISFSIGVVKCDPSSDLLLPDYLLLADEQMYEHKKARRKSDIDG